MPLAGSALTPRQPPLRMVDELVRLAGVCLNVFVIHLVDDLILILHVHITTLAIYRLLNFYSFYFRINCISLTGFWGFGVLGFSGMK